jgi:hypothetical protein
MQTKIKRPKAISSSLGLFIDDSHVFMVLSARLNQPAGWTSVIARRDVSAPTNFELMKLYEFPKYA